LFLCIFMSLTPSIICNITTIVLISPNGGSSRGFFRYQIVRILVHQFHNNLTYLIVGSITKWGHNIWVSQSCKKWIFFGNFHYPCGNIFLQNVLHVIKLCSHWWNLSLLKFALLVDFHSLFSTCLWYQLRVTCHENHD